MKLEEYQSETRQFAIYPPASESIEIALSYLGLGLSSESGEVAGVLKKYLRGDLNDHEKDEELKKELGDVLWYWVRLCDELALDIEEIMLGNITKLHLRKKKNEIKSKIKR